MKLRNRLLLTYSAMLLVVAVGLGLAIIVVKDLSDVADAMLAENIQAIDTSGRMRSLVAVQQSELSWFLARNPPGDRDELIAMMSPFVAEAMGLLVTMRRQARTPEELEAVVGSEQALAAVAQMTLAYAEPAHTLEPAAAVLAALDELRRAARLPYENHLRQLRGRGERVAAETDQLVLALPLIAGATVLVGLIAALKLARRLSQPLEAFGRATDRISKGDYTVRLPMADVEEIDQVGRSMNHMAASLDRFHAMRVDEVLAHRHRLDTVIDSIDQGLVIFDERGRIERVNPVAERQLGLSSAEACAMSPGALFPGSTLPDHIDALQARPMLALDHDIDGTDLVRDVDGSKRTLAWSLTAFSDAQRQGLLLMLRDVSEERALEHMRTEFVLRAAHELRTPATGLRMALGLLRDRIVAPPGSREAELLETLEAETARMVRLIASLLDLARLYNHNLSLMPTSICPAVLLGEAHDRFLARAQASDIVLALDVTPDLPRVAVDREQIDRVLDHLLSNALQHTPAGGRVGLRGHRFGSQLLVEVSDTGEGIAGDRRDRVFEPFAQVGRTTGGVGIGLAVSREVAEQHGGRLRVESSASGGCRFVLSLPLA